MPFVYFIQAGEDGPIKIGYSRNPQYRMARLQTAHWQQLFLVGVLYCESRSLEEELHRRFKKVCVRGEWYHPTKELLHLVQYSQHVDEVASSVQQQRLSLALNGHRRAARSMGWGQHSPRHVGASTIDTVANVAVKGEEEISPRSWRQYIHARIRQRVDARRPK